MLNKISYCFRSNKQIREIEVIFKYRLLFNNFICCKFFKSFIIFEFYLTSSNKKPTKVAKYINM